MLSTIIKTDQPKQVIDITEQVEQEIDHFYIKQGLIHLMLFHTTAALTTANLDPGTDLDLIDAYEEMVPKLNYRHAHNPKHVGDHIMSSLIGTSLTLPVEGNKLLLGKWQRVVLIEFNGPRERQLHISTWK